MEEVSRDRGELASDPMGYPEAVDCEAHRLACDSVGGGGGMVAAVWDRIVEIDDRESCALCLLRFCPVDSALAGAISVRRLRWRR